MPELPEVENLRLGLRKSIVGQKIKKIIVTKPKLVSSKGNVRVASEKKKREFTRGLTGEKFVSIDRRAKNLIFKLSHGKIILAHLKMSGQFVYKSKAGSKIVTGGHPIELSETTLPNKHSHVIFELERGVLYYNDTRMFGYMLYYPTEESFEQENHFGAYGIEPLSKDFTLKYFVDALKKKKIKIKALLMAQDIVTGVGNIYADESLFEARIRPDRSASSLTLPELTKLHNAIIRILKRAVSVGGSSVATYRLLDETRGNYAREHKVYGKAEEKCLNCDRPLSKTVIAARTTIFCPHCQK